MPKKTLAEKFLHRLGIKEMTFDEALTLAKTQTDPQIVNDFFEFSAHDVPGFEGSFRSAEIYRLKNRDLSLAKAVLCASYYNSTLKILNWIEKHKYLFSDSVLDVGCDIGVITCFIASICPQSHVKGIVLDDGAVTLAEQIAQQLKLNNVSFEKLDVANNQEKYNTVFSSRVAHEIQDNQEPSQIFLGLDDVLDNPDTNLEAYANDLSKALLDDGNLVSIERLGTAEKSFEWMNDLAKAGIHLKDAADLGLESLAVYIGKKELAADNDVLKLYESMVDPRHENNERELVLNNTNAARLKLFKYGAGKFADVYMRAPDDRIVAILHLYADSRDENRVLIVNEDLNQGMFNLLDMPLEELPSIIATDQYQLSQMIGEKVEYEYVELEIEDGSGDVDE